MKKIFYYFLFISFSLFFLFFGILILKGLETNKFNNFLSQSIYQSNSNIDVQLDTIKFKLDIKEISLFLETKNPKVIYRNINIPVKNIKVYVNFLSIIKSDTKIEKINLILNEISIKELKKLSVSFKPSNFTNLLNYKITDGKLNTEIDIYFNDKNLIENYIARGSVSEFKSNLLDEINLYNSSFTFFADKTDILIQNFVGTTGPIKIHNGDLKFQLLPEISIVTNFEANINYKNNFQNYHNLIKKLSNIKNISDFDGNLLNNLSIKLDKTYKIKNYEFKSRGTVSRSTFNFNYPIKNLLLNEKIKSVSIENSKFKINNNTFKKDFKIEGKYSFNNTNFQKFNLSNIIEDKILKIKLNTEYDKEINLEAINYNKPDGKIAKIYADLEKNSNLLKINEIDFKSDNSSILIGGVIIKDRKLISLQKILINTNNLKKKNNDFSIKLGKKIEIKGDLFDASNLPKYLNKNSNKNNLVNITKEIEINLASVIAPLSERLKNFRLIGEIEKGKFTKISSKGDFGGGNFLDITLSNDDTGKKKYLEIYSDLTKPLLTEFKFFNGLTGGNLLYSSIIEKNSSISKLKIENFKVINAPGMVKLLTLADLGGLADLAKGDGITFENLEINMEKKNDTLKLHEIFALGPSISVLMEGYQDKNTTSLRGTLVPAKNLNKIISKIPIIGDIVIPKEIGEGLFGVSFKMKGPPNQIKTTINPIRTLTPRFIQKIIDKKKIK